LAIHLLTSAKNFKLENLPCISGVQRQSSKSKTIMEGSFDLADDPLEPWVFAIEEDIRLRNAALAMLDRVLWA
jgi:hypothetical protein